MCARIAFGELHPPPSIILRVSQTSVQRHIVTFTLPDCWRIYYQTDDLAEYFADLEKQDRLPSLDTVLADAATLVDRYASQAATQNCLRASEITDPNNFNPVPVGSPWVARGSSTSVADKENSDAATAVHQEREGFTGDRVLRNSEIFMIDFGWWIEMAWSVPEGDIGGRFSKSFSIIWIFKFAGSSHQNYMKYLLEMYCLLRYESSKGLHDAILDNLLVRVKEEIGTYLAGDQHQEHYNRWLQDMSRRHGGEFDEPFFRQTISPNVEHFLRFKEEIETAFNLKHRTKAHTAPHQRPELRLLLSMFKAEEVHLFREWRSMGHAAVNQFARGCRLLEGKLVDFISTTTYLGEFHSAMNQKDIVAESTDSAIAPSNSEEDDDDMRPPSPTPSSSSGSSQSSAASTRSTVSLDSVLSASDPNEPENDGVDMSDVPHSSGSFATMYINEDTGLELGEEDGEVEDEEIKDVDEEGLEEEQEDDEDGQDVDDCCNEDEI
ncbi:hypothetical protein B0H13DRAFT_2310245 [Mycena leptocephala]|nr:hypothetical protein B0H13DRAFT_2310245 [Mycena leptocephala]